jgi:hypothetical protein
MKKIKAKTKTFDYSPIALRKLARHPFAPPVVQFTDKKKKEKRTHCRKNYEH